MAAVNILKRSPVEFMYRSLIRRQYFNFVDVIRVKLGEHFEILLFADEFLIWFACSFANHFSRICCYLSLHNDVFS